MYIYILYYYITILLLNEIPPLVKQPRKPSRSFEFICYIIKVKIYLISITNVLCIFFI